MALLNNAFFKRVVKNDNSVSLQKLNPDLSPKITFKLSGEQQFLLLVV